MLLEILYAFAVLQWGQISYRLWLFIIEYDGERGVNHLANGDFALIYLVEIFLLGLGLVTLYLLNDQATLYRRLTIGALVVNALGLIALIIVNQTGVLVEYSDYLHAMKKL